MDPKMGSKIRRKLFMQNALYPSYNRLRPKVITLMLFSLIYGVDGYSLGKQEKLQRSFVRVAVTTQTYSFFRPWEKKRPQTKKGIGVIISNNRILVTARLIANSTFIELERIEDGEKRPAIVIQKDDAANIALLAAEDKSFLQESRPLKIFSKKLKIGEKLNVAQFESNGTPVIAEGELRGIEVAPYPHGVSSKLVFNVEVVLANVGSSNTLPVLRRGKLVGLMMEHSQGTQTITVIPTPVINHFFIDLYDGQYDGFPQAAFSFSRLEDPQLRRFLGMTNGENGVFVDKVRPGGPAAMAGLLSGDVLLSIDHFSIDKTGQYNDPDYGKLSIAHLTTTRSYAGDKRVLRILRDKKEMALTVNMQVLKPEDYPVPPYIIDKAPKYFIAGGLVFQELSRQFLKEWGGSWKTASPQKLLYYQRNQWDLIEPGKKIVFLSQVLPSEGNIGYGGLAYMILNSINDTEISNLGDIPYALTQSANGFHKFEFEQDPNVIYLGEETLRYENEIILQRYNLPSLSRLN